MGDRRILVDPFFAEHEARLYPPLSVDEHGSDVDWLLVTHEHIDHLDPYSLREVAARSDVADGRRARRRCEARCARRPRTSAFVGVDRGDRLELPGAGAVTVVPAIHGRDGRGRLPGRPALRRLRARARAARASTTRATRSSPTRCARRWRRCTIDVALLPVNGRTYYRELEGLVGNMGTRDAVVLATEVGASILVPYHWDLFRGNTEWPGRVVDDAVEAEAPLHVLTLRRGVPWAL